MQSKNILSTFVVYAIMVFLAEITLGNPRFLINIWTFTTVEPWQWSIPVHLLGFAWLMMVNWLLSAHALAWSILLSTLFFLAAEFLNWSVFGFFTYADYPLGTSFSFWVVILLYACLAATCSLLLRWNGFSREVNPI
ncbi:MAG: hypothetical protein PHY31_07965 [Smithellaceae bacterium]|nr:hypothetical protein [Smithellaceae bacterium]